MNPRDGARGDGAQAGPRHRSPASSTSSKVWKGVGIAVVLIIATPFVVMHLHARSVAEQKCASARKTVENRIAREDFDEIERFVVEAERLCGAEYAAELQGRRREIAEKEQPARERQQRERRATAANEAADREELARDTFPVRSKDIEKEIKTANEAIAAGKLPVGMKAVARAEWALDEFKGTSVQQEQRYQELALRVGNLRKKVDALNAPNMEVIDEAMRQLQGAPGGGR